MSSPRPSFRVTPAPKPLPSFHLRKWLFFGVSAFCAHVVFSEHFYFINLASGPSMYPTVSPRGHMLLSSSRYRHGKGIGVGDFILFRSPYHLHDHSAKRVVGMPGDLVLRSAPRGDDKRHPEDMMIEVPEGHVWVIGDNLPWSRDSHMYGPIPMGMIKGKILAKAKTPFGWERIPNSLEPAQFAGDQ